MKYARVLPLVLVIVGLVACDRPSGYSHSSKEFNELDKKAVARVQGMVLGKTELLNSIAAEYTDEESPELNPCRYTDYEVSEVIRRDLNKIQGKYPSEIHVICKTSTKESGLHRRRYGVKNKRINLAHPARYGVVSALLWIGKHSGRQWLKSAGRAAWPALSL